MAWTPDEVAELLGSRYGDASERTAWLKEIHATLQVEIVDDLAGVVEKLADAARNASWRTPLGDSGLLDSVLSAVPAATLQHPLNKQALRLVGNACADCDENRSRVVEAEALRSFIKACLGDDSLLPFAVAATLNVCVDYKPAQEKASDAGLSKVLVEIVSGDRLAACRSSLSHIMTILELLCNQDSEPRVADPNTPAKLLRLAVSDRYDADVDTFMEICTPSLAYLTFESLQPVLVQNGDVKLLQLAFHQLYTRFDIGNLDPDTTGQLKQVGDAFLALFADISALPSFSSAYPPDSEVVQTLISWLELPPALSHLQTAACLALGNLTRSDESSTALLSHVQAPLIDILTRAVPPTASQPAQSQTDVPPLQLIHAALSFLKNLAIPQANKVDLGVSGLLQPPSPLLPRLWTSTRTQPQLQFAAVSLTRLLLANCPQNIHWICQPNPPESTQPSNLALLTSIAASADEEPIQTEAARAVALVCRALHSPTPSQSTTILDPSWTWTTPASPSIPSPTSQEDNKHPSTALTRFHHTHAGAITTSLSHLLTHPRFPALRSETLFVLALLSRSGAAHAALQVLQQSSFAASTTDKADGAAWRALVEAVTRPGSDEARLVVEGFLQSIGREGKERGSAVDEKVEGQQNDPTDGAGVSVKRLSLAPLQQVDPRQPAQAGRMDRENGMVLVAELLRRFPDELASLRRPLEVLLARGGELLMLDRAAQE